MVLNNVKVSVVIPSYNREKTIRRCLDSVISQTYKAYEIILVDDGSMDKTIEQAEALGCSYLKIIKQNHRGAQAARNLGIINACGGYIAFLDSDDEWLPTLLEEAVLLLQKEKRNIAIYTDGYIHDENTKKRRLWKLPGTDKNMYKFLLAYQAPTFSSLIVKKQCLIKIGLLDEKVKSFQEWETSIRLAKNYDFVHIKKPLFIYYLHSGETISKNKKKWILGYYYIVKKHKKEILTRLGFKGLISHYKILGKFIFYTIKETIL